jgi:hypothetical protein
MSILIASWARTIYNHQRTLHLSSYMRSDQPSHPAQLTDPEGFGTCVHLQANKSTVLRIRVVERVSNIYRAQIRLNGRVCRHKLQVDHDAVHKAYGSIDEAVIPDLCLAHLHGDGGNLTANKGSFNRARLARVDLQRVRLEEFGETLNVWETEVGVAPKACLATRGGCVCLRLADKSNYSRRPNVRRSMPTST